MEGTHAAGARAAGDGGRARAAARAGDRAGSRGAS